MIVVPDAGPLIYLAGAGQLDLLRRLYVEVGMALMTPGALVSSHSARIAARYSPVKVLRRGRATSVSEGFGVLVAVLNMVRSSDALLRSSGGCQCLTHVDMQGRRSLRARRRDEWTKPIAGHSIEYAIRVRRPRFPRPPRRERRVFAGANHVEGRRRDGIARLVSRRRAGAACGS